jgi:hypothetical protein
VVSVACCALRIFDAATICIALVICTVLLIDLIRRRMSRGLCIIKTPKSPTLQEIRETGNRNPHRRYTASGSATALVTGHSFPSLFELIGRSLQLGR